MRAVERLAVMRAGYRAGHSGLPSTSCPYLILAHSEAPKAAAWVRGWVYGRNDAEDTTGALQPVG